MTPTETEVWRRLAHRNMGLAFELSGNCYMHGLHGLPNMPETLAAIKQAGEETEAFAKTGAIPAWMAAPAPVGESPPP